MLRKNLCSELRVVLEISGIVHAYLFGSVLSMTAEPRDIDVLLLVEKSSDSSFRNELSRAILKGAPPLHFTVFSLHEHLDFVNFLANCGGYVRVR
jgi:predicted nucleotidyltransferase